MWVGGTSVVATWLWTRPSRLMDAPRLGTLVAMRVWTFWTIKADGCPEAGDLGCHSVVGLSIKAGGCPEVGDFGCHSGVDFWTIEADGCPGAGDFVCHLAVDLGCHWGVGFSAIRVDGSPGAGDIGLVRASDSSGNLAAPPAYPHAPDGQAMPCGQQKPWWPFLCSVSLDPS